MICNSRDFCYCGWQKIKPCERQKYPSELAHMLDGYGVKLFLEFTIHVTTSFKVRSHIFFILLAG